jgi:hypothetical protein
MGFDDATVSKGCELSVKEIQKLRAELAAKASSKA